MLQNIRQKITGPMALVVLALLCIPFIFVGYNYGGMAQGGFAVKVNGQEIPPQQIRVAYQNQAARIREQLDEIPPVLEDQLRQAAYEGVIRSTLLTQYLREQGYRVSDAAIQQSIREIPAFQENGQFSFELYRGLLAARGIVPARFEADQRRALQIDQLQSAVEATAFSTPSELRRYIELDRETRTISYLEFGIEDFMDAVEIGDEELQAYYDSHPELFQTPASVTFDYIEISRDTIAERITPSEEELRAYFEDVKDSYTRDQERNPSHILVTTDERSEDEARALAAELTERAKTGEDFAELAAEYSDDTLSAEQGGDLGWVARGQFVEPVEEAVFDMEEGEIRGPVESEFGFHVLRLDGVRGGGSPSLDEVRDEIVAAYRAERIGEQYLELSNALADQLFDTPNLTEAAAALDMPMRTAEDYTRSGSAELAPAPTLLDTLFGENAVPEGATSDLLNLAEDRVMVVQVTERREASRQPLADVRDEVERRARREAAAVMARAKLEELRANVEGGTPLEEAAAEVEAEAVADRQINRNAPDLPQALVAAVFSAEMPADGAKVGSVATADGGYVLYRLTNISPGRPETIPPDQREQARRGLARQAGVSDLSAFIDQLVEEAEIVRGTAAPFEDRF